MLHAVSLTFAGITTFNLVRSTRSHLHSSMSLTTGKLSVWLCVTYLFWWHNFLFRCRYNNNNNNKRQFVRRRNMSVDITRAPYRQSGNVVRDSSTEIKLWVIWLYEKMGFQALFKFVKCWRAPDVVRASLCAHWKWCRLQMWHSDIIVESSSTLVTSLLLLFFWFFYENLPEYLNIQQPAEFLQCTDYVSCMHEFVVLGSLVQRWIFKLYVKDWLVNHFTAVAWDVHVACVTQWC